MSQTYSEIVAEYADRLSFDRLPKDVVETAKISTLDYLGVVLAGSRTPSSRIIAEYVCSLHGVQEATVAAFGDRVPAPHAALANGTMAHSIELDDHEAHERSYVHPGVAVMPTAWAIAETQPVTGEEFLTAVVLGYEIIGRLSAATPPGYLDFKKGFHTTALFGPWAAASVAAKLRGLTREQHANAFGIIGSICSGLFETRAAGTWTKRLHPGWAGHNGIFATSLASKGFTGPRTILEGNHGLYRAFAGEGNFDLGIITDKLGETYEISLIMYKPYACAGVLHSPLTAVDEIRAKVKFGADDVEEILVRSAKKLVDHFTLPREMKYRPNSGAQGQFSLPYAVAVLVHDGAALLEQFSDEAVMRPSVVELAQRVRAEVDEELEKRWPEEEPSRVIITLRDGRRLTAEVRGGKGTLVHPMSAEELRAKFRGLATPLVGAARAAAIERAVMSIETNADVGPLMRELVID